MPRLDDPSCPTCLIGRGDEIDYGITGEPIFLCDTCHIVFTHLPATEGRGEPIILG